MIVTTYIRPGGQGNAAINDTVLSLVDNTFLEPLNLIIQQNTINGIPCLVVVQNEAQIVLGQVQYILPATETVIDNAVVSVPTTYYVYVRLIDNVPAVMVSTTDPTQVLLTEDYILELVIRFVSDPGIVIYYCKQPFQTGISGTVHNVTDESIFESPQWLSGFNIDADYSGYINTTAGQYRYPSNDFLTQSAITHGRIIIDNDQIKPTLTSIIQYSDNSFVTNGRWFKVLLGVTCDMGNYSTAPFYMVRQSKPATEYTTSAEAVTDAEHCAATAFPSAYHNFVTPLYYLVMKAGTWTLSDLVVIDVRSTGLSSSGGSSGQGTSDHHMLQNLTSYDDHTQYIPVNGTRPLTSNWNAGSHAIQALDFVSDVATGTAPISVASTTACPNLNADMLDGLHGTGYIKTDGTQPLTGDWAAAKNITTVGGLSGSSVTAIGLSKGNTFQSTQSTGSAPILVASTTVCPSLNADMLDGLHGTGYIKSDGTQPLTGDWAAAKSITTVGGLSGSTVTASGLSKGATFQSTQTTGTAPISVASDTVCPNLNADMIDGTHGSALIHADGSVPMAADLNMGGHSITNAANIDFSSGTFTGPVTASNFVSNVATGTAPLSSTSTTVCPNLNADMVDGTHGSALIHADGSVAMTNYLDMGAHSLVNASSVSSSGTISSNDVISAKEFVSIEGVFAPIIANSIAVCPNLNADMVDGTHGLALIHADGSVAMANHLDMGAHSLVNASSVSSSGTISSNDVISAKEFRSVDSILAPISSYRPNIK